MKIISEISQFDFSQPVALVPTMGALHIGHASLIKEARALSENVLVSVFINPLQFEDRKDFDLYPRTPQADALVASNAGARALWIASEREIYPPGFPTIPSPPVGELYEGKHRTGHFSGMLTVVNRLFALTKPTWAVFGEKDFQQLFLIKEMVKKQGLPIEIIAAPTVRDSDGLAISSRNVRLSDSDRHVALVLFRALHKASLAPTVELMLASLNEVLTSEPRFSVDYASIIDETNFEPAHDGTEHKRAIVAGWVNGVRLIDNMAMTSVVQ